MARKPRILIIYPGVTWSPYDIATGYQDAFESLGWDVYAFNYHLQFANYWNFLQYQNEQHGHEHTEHEACFWASQFVAIAAIETQPDIILIITGTGLHQRGFDHLKALGIPTACILTESPYMDDLQIERMLAAHVGIVFANDKVSVEPMRQAGLEAHYLPHSFNPKVHKPSTCEAFKTDVFFYGTLWPWRKQLIESLDLSAYNANVDGSTFETIDDAKHTVPNSEMAIWYANTKIALNHHRTAKHQKEGLEPAQIKNAYSLGPRAFEIAACGAFQVCDDTRPELQEVFGKSVPTYHDADDLQRLIDYYLAHDEERRVFATIAQQRVQSCSFQERAKNIIIPTIQEVFNGK